MSSPDPVIPSSGPDDPRASAADSAGPVPASVVDQAEADAGQAAEAAPQASTGAEGSARPPAKARKKRPCFHCGTMTSVKVLEKTGDLCWKCYRPAGYNLLKNLLVLAFALLGLAGLLVSWRVYFEEESFLNINLKKPPQDYRPREFTTEQKIQILRRHLLDRVPAKDLCDEFEVQPTEFARWKQQFFENAEAAFEQAQNREPSSGEKRAQVMEQKIQVIEKILVDLREQLSQLKKESGRYEPTPSRRYILESTGPPPRENK